MFSFALNSSIPIQGSDVAASWDLLYYFLVWLSIFFFVLVVGLAIYFGIKYKARDGVKPKYITHHHLLEAIWISIPFALLGVIFVWGYIVYRDMKQVPANAYEVRVIGKQWLWQFQYDHGDTTTGELYVPVNRPIRLVMTSEDVLHDFFIPNFRIKQDVVPGMYTSIWFEPKVLGKHVIYCAFYCGTSHSQMLAWLNVLTEEQFNDWKSGKKLGPIPRAEDVLAGKAPAPSTTTIQVSQASVQRTGSLAEQGKVLFAQKGCVSCHSSDGNRMVGPSVKGLYGRQVELADGRKLTADEQYLRTSIINPQQDLVQGYAAVMPTFRGLMQESEINAVTAYIKSLK